MLENEPIPPQEQGSSSDTFHTVECNTPEEAIALFNSAKQRLLNVNEWEQLTGIASADFQLTDANGVKVQRTVQQNDHFRINIPGPGNVSGKGYDWVQVEEIDELNEDDQNAVYVKVRPATNPQNSDPDVAHFFDEDATSTFTVKRMGKKVTSSVHGRNEKPNTHSHSENLIDKARNAIVSVSAMLGFSKSQWLQLAKGLIEGKKD
jgi:hypothetical protein